MDALKAQGVLPVEQEEEGSERAGPAKDGVVDRKKILCYLIHLRYIFFV